MFAIDPHRFGVSYPNAGELVYVGGKTAVMTAHASNNNTVSLTDLTGGVAAAPAQFDFIIAAYAIASPGDVDVTVVSAGYTERADLNSDVSQPANLGVFTKEITGAADTQIIVGPTGNANNAGVLAIKVWRYVDLVTPMDAAVTTAVSTTSGQPDPPAITPVTAGAVIVAMGAGVKSTAPATPVFTTSDLTAFLSAASDNVYDSNVGMGYHSWSGSGAFNPAQFTGGNATHGSAAATLALRPLFAPPVFSAIPTITSANGYFANGDTLTGVPGTHNGTHVSYQWKRDGVAIGGETTTSYTLSGSDLTHYITFSQLVSNGLPASTEATSAAIGPIADPAYGSDPLIPAGDMQGGSDVLLTAGDMQSGSDALLWNDRIS